MIAQVIKNQFDNKLIEYDVNLRQAIETPLHMKKDELPQWQFIKLIEGADRLRQQDNYATRHALILDIDKNWNIADFEREYSHLTYAIHTTSNHTNQANRFRVILPLDSEYSNMLFRHKPVHEALANYFPGFDPSSLVNFHKLPALPVNQSDYYYNFNSGRRFGYSDIKSKVEEIELSEEIERQFNASLKPKNSFLSKASEDAREAYKRKTDQNMDRLVASLPSHSTGSRYSDFCSVMGKMLNAKYPDEDFIYTTEEIKQRLKAVYWDHALDKAFRSFSRRRH